MPISRPEEVLNNVRSMAERSGAAEAEVYFDFVRFVEVRYREGEVELLQQSAITGLGLRVLRDRKMGFCYTTNLNRTVLDELVVRTVALASQATPRDENRLPDQQFPPQTNLEIEDPYADKITPQDLIVLAKALEDNALLVNKVKTTQTARAGYVVGETHFSNTFIPYQTFRNTQFWLYCSAVATDGSQKRVGSFTDRKRNFQDLTTPDRVGRKAGERAVARLGAKPVPSARVPVIFEAEAAGGFLGGLFGAFIGLNVLEQRSFLGGKKGQTIGSPLVTLVDDAILRRGLGTRPFDGEGTQTSRRVVVDRGVLTRYLHTAATARREGVTPSGSAWRGYDSLPAVGPSNFYLENGSTKLSSMIEQVPNGLFVTGTAGFGFDLAAGDYSQQVEGNWIEKGKLGRPVDGITVAGKISDMLMGVDSVGRDLDFRAQVCSPSIRFKELTVGGG